MRRIGVFFILMIAALAQVPGPMCDVCTKLYFYDASGNIEYICAAAPVNPESTFLRSGTLVTLTSIADSSNTATVTTGAAHGLQVGNLITVSGATVDSDLNGDYYIQTVPLSTTFTITTANVTDATYNESTLQFTTRAARDTLPIWHITKYISGANGPSHRQESTGGANSICANRATSTGANKVTYR